MAFALAATPLSHARAQQPDDILDLLDHSTLRGVVEGKDLYSLVLKPSKDSGSVALSCSPPADAVICSVAKAPAPISQNLHVRISPETIAAMRASGFGITLACHQPNPQEITCDGTQKALGIFTGIKPPDTKEFEADHHTAVPASLTGQNSSSSSHVIRSEGLRIQPFNCHLHIALTSPLPDLLNKFSPLYPGENVEFKKVMDMVILPREGSLELTRSEDSSASKPSDEFSHDISDTVLVNVTYQENMDGSARVKGEARTLNTYGHHTDFLVSGAQMDTLYKDGIQACDQARRKGMTERSHISGSFDYAAIGAIPRYRLLKYNGPGGVGNAKFLPLGDPVIQKLVSDIEAIDLPSIPQSAPSAAGPSL